MPVPKLKPYLGLARPRDCSGSASGGCVIVTPDFPDHWKTRLLVALTSDPSAPLGVIRLWSHCQQCKASKFPNLTPESLAAICQSSQKPADWEAALLKAGFIKKKAGIIIVHEWEIVNASLIASWNNGRKRSQGLADVAF